MSAHRPDEDVVYPITSEMRARIDRDFTYHSPLPTQPERYEMLRSTARDLAEAIVIFTPPSREQSAALTHLDEVVMFANAAIARNE